MHWSEWIPELTTVFWTLVLLLECFAIVRAILRSRGVESTLAWIFAIIALPGVGALAYLILAAPTYRRAARRKLSTTRAMPRPDAPGPEAVPPLLELTTRLTGLAPIPGNSVSLLTESVEAFRRIETAIAEARHSIWAECYLIRNDETGHRFLDCLEERARAGIEIRLLYDAFGSMRLDAGRLAAIRAAKGRVEAFLPLNPLRRRFSVHLRNHRKLILVDGRVGFTGGMNVGDEYSGRALRKGRTHFRDSHLEIRGPAVAALARIFAADWLFSLDERRRRSSARRIMKTIAGFPRDDDANTDADADANAAVDGAALAQTSAQLIVEAKASHPASAASAVIALVPSGPDQEHNSSGLVYFTGIAMATERIWLTSPYFIPDEATATALASAALRGVDVRVLVPKRCDVVLVGLAARTYYATLLRAGVRIFEYTRSMLHAKTVVVDGAWGMVGSANVDIRSFRLNFELGTLVYDRDFVMSLEARFRTDLEESREVTAAELGRGGFLRELATKTARLLSPML